MEKSENKVRIYDMYLTHCFIGYYVDSGRKSDTTIIALKRKKHKVRFQL